MIVDDHSRTVYDTRREEEEEENYEQRMVVSKTNTKYCLLLVIIIHILLVSCLYHLKCDYRSSFNFFVVDIFDAMFVLVWIGWVCQGIFSCYLLLHRTFSIL
jgi:uncharacterized integral membrane protein